MTFVLLVIGFGASALGGMLGMAGGIFVVPLLTTFALAIDDSPSRSPRASCR